MTVVYTNANIFQGTKDELLNNAWFLVGDDGALPTLAPLILLRLTKRSTCTGSTSCLV